MLVIRAKHLNIVKKLSSLFVLTTMTLSEVNYACVVIRRPFYHPISIPGVADHHVLFRVVVSVPETNGNSTTKQFNPHGSLLFIPRSRTFLIAKPYPKVATTSSQLPSFPTFEPRSSKFKVGLYSLCTCSSIDNVILTDCNRLLHPIPPNLVAQHPSSPTVQVCPDFIPLTYIVLIMSCLDQFE